MLTRVSCPHGKHDMKIPSSDVTVVLLNETVFQYRFYCQACDKMVNRPVTDDNRKGVKLLSVTKDVNVEHINLDITTRPATAPITEQDITDTCIDLISVETIEDLEGK